MKVKTPLCECGCGLEATHGGFSRGHATCPPIIPSRVGSLTVLRYIKNKGKSPQVEVRCDCGKTKVIYKTNLGRNTNSCGCERPDRVSRNRSKHGEAGRRRTPEFNVWVGMRARCYDHSNRSFHRYGGRNIRMCRRWFVSYENFLQDMGRRPSPLHSIERINNDGNYCRSNCRWATKKEQANNRVTNIPKRLVRAALRGYDKLPRCPSGKKIVNGELSRLAAEIGLPARAIQQLNQMRKREARNAG